MLFANPASLRMPTAEEALPGRNESMPLTGGHFVHSRPIAPPFPDGMTRAVFGMGCFWGAERAFWKIEGVYTTAVGYAGGLTTNPTYHEVCSGGTGHTEAVLVVADPAAIPFERLLQVFCRATTRPRACGRATTSAPSTARRSTRTDAGQRQMAEASRDGYQARLTAAGFGPITTEIRDAPSFYYAEEHHQQYLAKNPGGYCGVGGTGIRCPAGLGGRELTALAARGKSPRCIRAAMHPT